MRLLLVAALLLAPGASALFEGYGTLVGDDAPAARTLLFDGPREFVFADDNNDGNLNAGEAVFLAASTRLAAGDVWLTRQGELLSASSGPVGATMVANPGSLRFLSERGDDTFGPDDLLVLDAAGSEEGRLSASDLILSGPHAGMFAAQADVNLNTQLTDLSAPAGYRDNGNGQYDPGEAVFFDTNQDGVPSPVDVQAAGDGFGTILGPEDDISLHLLEGPAVFAFIDEGGTGGYAPGDAVYLTRELALRIGSIRLVPVHGTEGLHVRSGDSDAFTARAQLPAQLSVTGEDDHVEAGEHLILDITSLGQAGRLDASDIVLSGPEAGTSAGDAGLSLGVALRTVPAPRFVDLDGDRRFGLGDLAYYDADASGFVSRGDIQLVTVPELVPDDTPTETPTDTPTETQTETAPTETDAPTETQTETEDPAIPALPLGLVAAALLLARRW